MICPNCGNTVPDGRDACLRCGTNIRPAQTPLTAQGTQGAQIKPYEQEWQQKKGNIKGILSVVIFVIIIAVILFILIDPFDPGDEELTMQEFYDKYGTVLTPNEVGDEVNIKDTITQIVYYEDQDKTCINFASTGTETDPYEFEWEKTYDIIVDGDQTGEFRKGHIVKFKIEVKDDGIKVKDLRHA